jgi:hypothetical protein
VHFDVGNFDVDILTDGNLEVDIWTVENVEELRTRT